MFTRKDYMNKKCSHREYYAQFVTEHTKEVVSRCIGVDRLIKSEDRAFNDIPLREWDALQPALLWQVGHKNKELGAYETARASLSDIVCTAKEAARQIVEEQA